MNIERINALITSALTPAEASNRWGLHKPTANDLFGGVGKPEGLQAWSSETVLKLGSTIKALKIEIEWIVSSLIPLGAVILFYARGGIGKSTLMMMLAGCVAAGRPFLGIPTQQRAVIYVDFENSLAVLSERLRSVGADNVLFWSSADMPARLDDAEVQRYFDILIEYPGALYIFDTLRSSQSGDENDSKHMAEIMALFRRLRDRGATVIVLHHTTKAAETRYKGSSAIFDMVDHVLAMYPVRQPGDDAERSDDDDESPVYRFGTKDKTRYEPFVTYLQFDPETKQFQKAPDPTDQQLIELQSLLVEMVNKTKGDVKQGDIIDAAKDELDLSKTKTIRLLNRGVDQYWSSRRGEKNARIFTPIDLFSCLPTPYTHGKQENWKTDCQTPLFSDDTENENPIETVSLPVCQKNHQAPPNSLSPRPIPPPPPPPQTNTGGLQ